jgi:hypothetical protein
LDNTANTQAVSPSRVGEWLAESLRWTAIGPEIQVGEPLFEKLTGVKPQEQVNRPAQAQFTEAGVFRGFRISIAQQLGRVDVLFTDDPQANTIDPTRPNYKPFYSIGEYSVAATVAREIGRRLVDCFGPEGTQKLAILAYGPILLRGVESVIDWNELLAIYLPNVRFDPKNDTDIFWQINRPRLSMIHSGKINRVSKWHVLAFQMIGVLPLTPQPLMRRKAALRLEMDLNFNPASLSPPSLDLIARGLDELYNMAAEIADKGDIP